MNKKFLKQVLKKMNQKWIGRILVLIFYIVLYGVFIYNFKNNESKDRCEIVKQMEILKKMVDENSENTIIKEFEKYFRLLNRKPVWRISLFITTILLIFFIVICFVSVPYLKDFRINFFDILLFYSIIFTVFTYMVICSYLNWSKFHELNYYFIF